MNKYNVNENVVSRAEGVVKSCSLNTNNLPDTTTTCGSIETSGTVTVKSTDNVIFEAKNEVILDAGFEIESGGTFEIHINPIIMNCCED
jgi:DNA-directed RNA polymerase alpha subunit